MRWVGACKEGIPLEVPSEIRVRPGEKFTIQLRMKPLRSITDMTVWLTIRFMGKVIKQNIFSYSESFINSLPTQKRAFAAGGMTRTITFTAPREPGEYHILIQGEASARVSGDNWCYSQRRWKIKVIVEEPSQTEALANGMTLKSIGSPDIKTLDMRKAGMVLAVLIALYFMMKRR